MEPLQNRIEKAKRELEHMIDLNPQVMLLMGHDGRITRANRALLDLMGLTGYPSVLGKRLEDLFLGNDSVGKILIRRDGSREHEAEVTLAGGRRLVLHFTVVGVGADGELTVVMVRDVGAEKEQAASLALRHKTEAVKAVAGALMHNVNQSLTVIMVNAQLLNLMLEKGVMNPADVANSLVDIVRETTSIAELLKNLSSPNRFVTEPYPGSTDILDIRRSAECGGTGPDAAPRAYVWLESSFAAAVDLLLKALDAHEGGSFRHARQTAGYAAILARRMGYAEGDVAKIRNCATLHDIGKLGIPDSILCKPSSLGDDEMRVMRTHAEIGYNLLRNLPFVRGEAEVAWSHHERWDGSGYPQGLKGKDIHPMARIVSVADALDALRVERSYHQVASEEAVAGGINAGAGSQFDPDVVEAFNESREELEKVSVSS